MGRGGRRKGGSIAKRARSHGAGLEPAGESEDDGDVAQEHGVEGGRGKAKKAKPETRLDIAAAKKEQEGRSHVWPV